MSSIDFSSCPEFKALVDDLILKDSKSGIKGAVKKALNAMIQDVDGGMDRFKDDFTSEEGKKFHLEVKGYFENISSYFEISKKAFSQDEQREIENKIKILSGRISDLTKSKEKPGLSFFSYLSPYYWIGSSEKTTPTTQSSTFAPAKYLEENGCYEKPDLAKDISAQITATKSALDELKSSFDVIESCFLSTKDFSSLQEQILVVKEHLQNYQMAFNQLHDFTQTLPSKGYEEVQEQLEIFELSLKQFTSYTESLEVALHLQTSENSSQGPKKPSSEVSRQPDSASKKEEAVILAKAKKGVACDVGLPNLGVTCYVNTFLKTSLPYFDLLRNKELTRKRNESNEDWANRNDLRVTLLGLAEELRSARPDRDRIHYLILTFVNNPLLDDEIPKFHLEGTTSYHMGDSRGVATRVFDLLEMDNDPAISIVRGSLLEEIGGQKRISPLRGEARETSISIAEGRTMQEMINSSSSFAELDYSERWKPDEVHPVRSRKKEILVADPSHLPQRLIFTITQAAVNQSDQLRDIEDVIYVPIHDRRGRLLGRMQMQLEAVACNSPNAHFLGYVRAPNGSWTEHNDSIITAGLTKKQMCDQTSMRASYYGCQFNYVTTGFFPA